nr:MAG TPA: hypothetical protein [Caudoviricetes sp.]
MNFFPSSFLKVLIRLICGLSASLSDINYITRCLYLCQQLFRKF